MNLKALIFNLREVYLGVRLDQVRRVVMVPDLGGVANGIGIAEIDAQAVTVLDLEQRLYPDTPVTPKNFLLLLSGNSNETYGILIPDAPSLYTIPLTRIRQLPVSYRQGGHLGLATHLALIEKEQDFRVSEPELAVALELEETQEPLPPAPQPQVTIFLLDTPILLATLVPRFADRLSSSAQISLR